MRALGKLLYIGDFASQTANDLPKPTCGTGRYPLVCDDV